MVFEEDGRDGEDFAPGLYFASTAEGTAVRRRGLVDIVPIFDGEPLPYTYSATPSLLKIDTDKGSVRLVFDTANTLRIAGKGVGVRLYVKIPFLSMMGAQLLPSGVVDFNLRSIQPGGGVFFFKQLKGKITLDAKFDPLLNGPEYIQAELLPDESGEFETAGYSMSPDEWGYIAYKPIDDVVAETDADFSAFISKLPDVGESRRELARVCGYTLWIHLKEKTSMPEYNHLIAGAVYTNRLLNGSAVSFEQPLYAMTLADAADAVSLIGNAFNYMRGGMLPTNASNADVFYQAFPPVHGVALGAVGESGLESVGADVLRKLYDDMAEHYTWWVNTHSRKPGHFSYNERSEYAFKGSSYGTLPFPLEAPDLYAYLIRYAEALGTLAGAVGNGEEGKWSKVSQELTRSLLELWDGERFVCKDALSGQTHETGSVFAYIPVILGKRLPADVLAKLVAGLACEDTFLGAYGLRSESKKSPYYSPEAAGRGAVDAALQMLLTGGLFDAGALDEAAAAAERFLSAARQFGARDMFAPEGGQPIRRPGDDYNALGSAAVLYLAHKLHTL
jgi:hypothetical protein